MTGTHIDGQATATGDRYQALSAVAAVIIARRNAMTFQEI